MAVWKKEACSFSSRWFLHSKWSLCCTFVNSDVLTVQMRSSVPRDTGPQKPFHMCSVDGNGLSPSLPPEIDDHLLGFRVVLDAPPCQLLSVLPAGCFITPVFRHITVVSSVNLMMMFNRLMGAKSTFTCRWIYRACYYCLYLRSLTFLSRNVKVHA